MSNRKPNRKEKVSSQANVDAVPKTKGKAKSGLEKWYPLLVAVVGFLVYANSLNHGYVLDDYSLILENNSTQKGFHALHEIFTTSYRFGYYFSSDELYRPLSKAILAIEWGIAPHKPSFAHLVNVLLFAFSGFVLYKCLLRWLNGNVFIAFSTSLLFMVHPMHTEAVSNIKSVDELLGFLFGMLAIDAAFQFAKNNQTGKLILSGIFFFCAMLSKESSVTFLAVMPLVIYFFADKKEIKNYLPVGVAFFCTLFFMLIRSKVLGAVNVSLNASVVDNLLMAAHGKMEQITTAVYLLGLYLYTMLLPLSLSFDRSFPDLNIVSVTDWRFILSAVLLTAMLLVAIITFKKKNILSFIFLFFFITVSISSNIFVLIGTHWGERLMFTPLLSFCLLISVLLHRYSTSDVEKNANSASVPKNAMMILIVIACIYGGMSVARNPVWKDNGTLYSSGLISAPNSSRVQYYMGNYLIKDDLLAGKSKEEQEQILNSGIGYLKNAVKLFPAFSDAWNQMGVAYYRLKNMDQAISCYRQGIKINPNDATLHSNIGTALYSKQIYPEALQEFQKAVAINPNYVEAWANVGSTYGLLGQFDMAIPAFEKAIAINPNYAQAYFFLGITWRNKGNEMLANQFLEKAYAIDPSLRR